MPEFDVVVVTVRSGTRTVRVEADNAVGAWKSIQAECDTNQCHCPVEFCTDSVESGVFDVKQVVLDGVTIISADGGGGGTLYADDTLRRTEPPHA